jgi:hypothetical protein
LTEFPDPHYTALLPRSAYSRLCLTQPNFAPTPALQQYTGTWNISFMPRHFKYKAHSDILYQKGREFQTQYNENRRNVWDFKLNITLLIGKPETKGYCLNVDEKFLCKIKAGSTL